MEREKKRSIKKGIVGSCVVDDRGGTRQNKEEKKEKKKKTTHKETRKREKKIRNPQPTRLAETTKTTQARGRPVRN
jgi:hypothetical protein